MTSRLKINQFELSLFLGWSAEERSQTQRISLDIDLTFSLPPKACQSDELTDTICYFELTEKLRHHFTEKTFRLIEHLAHDIYQFLKNHVDSGVSVMVHLKKQPDIKQLHGGVCFSYGD